MKSWKRLTLSVAGAVAMFMVTPKAEAANFTDVSDDFWAKDSIEYLAKREIINGYSDGSFKPNQDITRSQAAAMIVRALDLDTSGRPHADFSDVSDNHPNDRVINAVSDEGIIRASGKLFLILYLVLFRILFDHKLWRRSRSYSTSIIRYANRQK
ncbi:S-layer homology domain-containing protein [Alteribacillus sp. YIM 98480]|uniref:S-layer homology domain-containing protein n=1 Tax=Alteribacillus sp. YIM 98480 TaxID=2606599 RepID=UPI00131B3F89|nr:S-layer homology domain-containing protein [Alteribacillus sp. YIM 98480]